MELQVSAVVKEGNRWFIGKISGIKFITYKQVRRLKDVKEVASYITFKEYLKGKNKSVKIDGHMKRNLNLDSIYVLDKPTYCNEKEFEEYWWADLNEYCIKCVKECKQSSYATLWKCDGWKGKEEE